MDMETIQFALDMEQDGERYYREQARKNEHNALREVFELLADEEKKHAEILRQKAAGQPYALKNSVMDGQENLFQNAKDYVASVREIPDQAELYERALEVETRSIALYEKLRDQAAAESAGADQELFVFLIGEERRHQAILEEMYHHVNRPKEWVEAAEFGVREEY